MLEAGGEGRGRGVIWGTKSVNRLGKCNVVVLQHLKSLPCVVIVLISVSKWLQQTTLSIKSIIKVKAFCFPFPCHIPQRFERRVFHLVSPASPLLLIPQFQSFPKTLPRFIRGRKRTRRTLHIVNTSPRASASCQGCRNCVFLCVFGVGSDQHQGFAEWALGNVWGKEVAGERN